MSRTADYEIKDFQNDVLQRSHTMPVVVDFWAAWCGPCKILGPVLERLAGKSNNEWALATVDTDRHQNLAAEYGIRSIPAVKLFVDDKVVHEFVGALPEHMILQWLKKELPNKHRKSIEQAKEFLLRNEIETAQRLLEAILAQDPRNQDARVLLARSLLRAHPDKAAELVREIEEHSEHFPMVEAIRTYHDFLRSIQHPELLPDDRVRPLYIDAMRQLSANNFDAALEKFIEVLRNNRSYDDEGARRACITIFRILGDEDELTQKYRRSFSGALSM